MHLWLPILAIESLGMQVNLLPQTIAATTQLGVGIKALEGGDIYLD